MAERGSRVDINLTELEKLCQLQCTDEEIGAWFNVSTRTIERRRLEPEFAEIMDRGKAKGRISVRRMQMKMLEEGNATMGVWLGKQILGQTDHVAVSSGEPLLVMVLPRSGDGEQEAIDIDVVRGDSPSNSSNINTLQNSVERPALPDGVTAKKDP